MGINYVMSVKRREIKMKKRMSEYVAEWFSTARSEDMYLVNEDTDWEIFEKICNLLNGIDAMEELSELSEKAIVDCVNTILEPIIQPIIDILTEIGRLFDNEVVQK